MNSKSGRKRPASPYPPSKLISMKMAKFAVMPEILPEEVPATPQGESTLMPPSDVTHDIIPAGDWLTTICQSLGDDPALAESPTDAILPPLTVDLAEPMVSTPPGTSTNLLLHPTDEVTTRKSSVVPHRESTGKLNIYELPNHCYDLGEQTFALISDFKDVPKLHLREYVGYGQSTLYPSKKGIAFNFQEWKYVYAVLQTIRQKYEVPLWGGDQQKAFDLPSSQFGITVNADSTKPGTFKLYICKSIRSKTGTDILNTITLNEQQSNILATKCEDMLGDFVERVINSKINSFGVQPNTIDIVRDSNDIKKQMNVTFKGLFFDEIHQKLNNFMCVDSITLYDSMISIDIGNVIDELLKFYPDEYLYHDKVCVNGYVRELLDKFVLTVETENFLMIV